MGGFILVGLATISTMCLVCAFWLLQASATLDYDGKRNVKIPAGSHFDAIIDTLAASGILGHERRFRFVARITGWARQIKPGHYTVASGMSTLDLLNTLRRGLQKTLPEKVARRRSKYGFWVPQDPWLCGPLRPALTQWLNSDRPLWDWMDRATVRRFAEETWEISGRRDEPGQALVRCFMLDKWIEVFDVN